MTTLQQRILESIRGLNRRANAVLLAFVLAALAQTTAAQQYQLSYLDDLGGNSRGNSINNRGWILGFSLLSGFPQETAKKPESSAMPARVIVPQDVRQTLRQQRGLVNLLR